MMRLATAAGGRRPGHGMKDCDELQHDRETSRVNRSIKETTSIAKVMLVLRMSSECQSLSCKEDTDVVDLDDGDDDCSSFSQL